MRLWIHPRSTADGDCRAPTGGVHDVSVRVVKIHCVVDGMEFPCVEE